MTPPAYAGLATQRIQIYRTKAAQAVPSVHFPGQTDPTTPRRPLHLSSGNNIKSRSGRFQLAEFSTMEVTLY